MKSDLSLPRYFLSEHLKQWKQVFRGRLLNAGCGDRTYEHIYAGDIDFQIRMDWPQTVHTHGAIDVFGSVMQLPFHGQKFDVILCTEVLEHVNNPVQTLREFERVLVSKGKLIISVPFLYQVHEAPYDFFRYTPFGLRHLLETSGFHVVAMYARGELFAVVLFFWRKLMAKIMRRMLGRFLSSKLPWRWLDITYLWLFGKRQLRRKAEETPYTLGYSILAEKKN